MIKHGIDAKVKKTLVRNVEKKTKPTNKQPAIIEMGCSDESSCEPGKLHKDVDLDQPSLCSSEALANYLTDRKNTLPYPSCTNDLDLDKCQLNAKVTKKLNFHLNDKIYKNLIELNSNINELKTKKDRRPISSNTKRDLEPNIEDFCIDDKDDDHIPSIPVIKPKFKPVKNVENGQLHKLCTTFEDL